jgi:hypothetical protein
MPVLTLGVWEIPYTAHVPVPTKSGKPRKTKTTSVAISITTGDVAEILEEEYHILETFFEVYHDKICDLLVEAIWGDMDNVLNGRRPNADLFAPACSEIETLMKRFITTREIEYNAFLAGNKSIPTQAALHGVNHRLAHPYSSKNPRRPSFLDSGLMVSSYHAEVEQ